VTVIEDRVEELERRALALQPDIGRTAMLAQEILRLRRAAESLAERAGQLQSGDLSESLSQLENDIDVLRRDLTTAQNAPAGEPPLVDLRWRIPVVPGREYAKRSLGNVRYIVVEHTATLEDVTPEQLAATHLEQGKPAIACHFLVARDGTIYWTQPLEAVVHHALLSSINQSSIAVSLSGNFSGQAPDATQLTATAALLAWLVGIFGLDLTAIRGRRELEDVPSPGAQWSSGANYKETLLALVREGLEEGHRRPNGAHRHTAGLLATGSDGRVPRPNIVDVVSSLPKHPTLKPYPTRPKPVSVIAIHHTDTPKTLTVQQIAQYHVYGVKRDAKGNWLKAQWPGIGYHFVIAANGTIYQCQREQTRSYHVGSPSNDYCLGVSFIGRFMRLGYDGKIQRAADQIPTPAQLQSGGQLIAWLMQEFNIPIEKVLGHKNVVGGSTACPGEHWETGLKWRSRLQKEIQAATDAAQECEGNQPIEHYLLFWDRGSEWAAVDWSNAQSYIARFRPTTGFSVIDALQARHVTIVGGPSGVSAADEARLRSACIHVNRLSGATAAATKAMLDALVAQGTPWPGAPPRSPSAAAEAEPLRPEGIEAGDTTETETDEWTVPEDWEQLLAPPDEPTESPGQVQAG
jgi:N-acetyl-anhydromuramyl-L-alanine amidase AmpD